VSRAPQHAALPERGKPTPGTDPLPDATALYGEEFLADTPRAVVEQLGRDGARHVYVDGGDVIQQFLGARLVDDLTLSVVPVVLGGGIRLFADRALEQRLTLEEARSWSSGLAQLRYRVA
jgi:dihydrofolate reductase